MANPQARSYASTLGSGTQQTQPAQAAPKKPDPRPSPSTKPQNDANPPQSTRHHPHKRSPSPAHVPNTGSKEESVYVLTFRTDAKHAQTMTNLRKKYFPPRLNKLDAHLTLFHALPGSKLDDSIIPVLESTASSTESFHILASTPFKLKHGIAVGVPKGAGGDAAREVHAHLKGQWRAFLSDQDAGGFAAHYTIMNKVDDPKVVDHSFEEVESEFKACKGTVNGLTLWLYDRGKWTFAREFAFR